MVNMGRGRDIFNLVRPVKNYQPHILKRWNCTFIQTDARLDSILIIVCCTALEAALASGLSPHVTFVCTLLWAVETGPIF